MDAKERLLALLEEQQVILKKMAISCEALEKELRGN